jgi:hypothetical protein
LDANLLKNTQVEGYEIWNCNQILIFSVLKLIISYFLIANKYKFFYFLQLKQEAIDRGCAINEDFYKYKMFNRIVLLSIGLGFSPFLMDQIESGL